MSVPSFTVYTGETPDFKAHPRLFCRYTEKTAITARTNSSSSWQGLWDGAITTRANTLKGSTDAAIVGSDNCFRHLMILSLYGWIEETGRPANGYKDVAIRAVKYLAGLADSVQPTNKRYRLLSLALVFDFLYDDMTTAERDTVAAEIIQQVDRMTLSETDEMDGYSGIDQMCALAGELSVHGYALVAAEAASRLQTTLEFFYGATANRGRIQMCRYQYADGGTEKGGGYTFLGAWGELWMLWFLKNGTSIDTWTQEASWAQKIYEWLIWNFRAGSYDDFETQGDWSKTSNPRFHEWYRWMYSILATKYTNVGGAQGGQMLRKIYDIADTYDAAYGNNLIFDVIFLDKANITAVEPQNATTPPAASRMFSPPGVYYYRQVGRSSGFNRWNLDEAHVIRISARKWYYLGHAHLDGGSVRMDFKGDPLLLAPAGVYDSYGGSHHMNAYQRSWLQSLCPLVKDPTQIYQRYSTTVFNDGGQHFRKYDAAVAPAITSDPATQYNMQNDAGGLAWLRCEKFTKVAENSDYVFLSASLREAYRKKYTDPHRTPILDVKYLIIEPTAANGLTYAALLYYARIQKADSSWVTEIPFHAPASITSTSYGFHWPGYYGVGKVWVDVRDVANYTKAIVAPGSPLDANGYGPDQFKASGAGTNWVPSSGVNSREVTDVKTHSVFLTKTNRAAEEHYVCLLMLSAAGDSEPASSRAWVTDAAQPDYYGITLGSSTYLIHRTQDVAVLGGPDTTPPANATGLAVAPRDGALRATWTDPADSDFDHLKIWIRTSAV